MADARRSGRFAAREATELRRELLVEPWPEGGLVVADSPFDPDPELVGWRVVETGWPRARRFRHAQLLYCRSQHRSRQRGGGDGAAGGEIARMLVDMDVPREQLRRIGGGCTPAKLVEIIGP